MQTLPLDDTVVELPASKKPPQLSRKKRKQQHRALVETLEQHEASNLAFHHAQKAHQERGTPGAKKRRKQADKVLHPERYMTEKKRAKLFAQLGGGPK